MSKFNREQRLRNYSREKVSYGSDMVNKYLAYGTAAYATYKLVKKGAPLAKKLLEKAKGG